MTSHERAAELFIEASRAYLDGPTEDQVAMAIHEAEEEVWLEIQIAFSQSKKPELAEWLDKLRDRTLKK